MSSAHDQLRVLIVRLGAMGDILHALPAVASLRKAHPRWFLSWVVEPRWISLLKGATGEMPIVDQVHLANAKRWSRSPLSPETLGGLRSLRKELRAGHYDVCVDLQGAVRSAMIGRLARAPRLIGESDPREPAARWLFSERVPTRGSHVIEQAIEVCHAISNDRLQPRQPALPSDPDSEAWAEQILGGEQLNTGFVRENGAVIISPGAGWGAKRWPADRYGAVAKMLFEAGYQVLVNAGPEEKQIAQQVAAASGNVVQVPEFTVSRLIATTRRVCLVIAGDSGPLHLACALGIPVVGIYGPTEPQRNGPFGSPSRVLRHPESKRDHSRHANPEAGLLTITERQVLDAAIDLLEKGK